MIRHPAVHKRQWLPLRIAARRVRVADIAFLPLGRAFEAVLITPPVAIVEVLSPEDRVSRYQSRLDDYGTMGVANIWVIDPMRRKAYDCSQGGWQAVDRLIIPNTPVEIPFEPLWKKLNALHP